MLISSYDHSFVVQATVITIVNYNRKTFIVQATGVNLVKLILSKFTRDFFKKIDHFIIGNNVFLELYNGVAYIKRANNLKKVNCTAISTPFGVPWCLY